jgi:quinoprotein glucose dehydrogenase
MKNTFKGLSLICLVALASFSILSCLQKTTTNPLIVVNNDHPNPIEQASKIRSQTPIKLADGLKMSLWANDSLAPDPIAMSIDDEGSVYITRSNRARTSEFDIRGHQNWMTASIGLQTVEDRRAFLKTTFAPEKSNENKWLPDLNNDGLHDWKDLTVETEEIWKLEDKNKDGIADISTQIYSGFNEEINDVAGALLVREKDVFLGVGPDMWRMTDFNKDGILDKKTSIAHGYNVHIGFGGHGMSGVIEGPDGKLYWNSGDIGANIISNDGKKFEYPNEGVISRSNPDGSDFEIFASGLRNTHEFVFDQYGNLISSDNDGDHPGESERLVHIVEGSDAGWRANWQYGKYTDPKNNKYKVWMDEKLFKPRWEGQAAYIIPPIMNYHNGPTGMLFNPGTALGKAWLNKFFLVEFVGSASRSHIWSFGLKPKGASFELDGEIDALSGILPTGIKFGPDGAMYIADWINGWDVKNFGKVWKLDVSQENEDLTAERKETERLIKLKYGLQTDKMLEDLLSYADMRVRQKAQFELAERGIKSFANFKNIIETSNNQLARIHAIWGIGQLAAKQKELAGILVTLLNDKDEEIITQAIKTLGSVKFEAAAEQWVALLKSQNYRIKFYAAEAIGKFKYAAATPMLIEMLIQNNDQDLYIRHAAVLALSKIGAEAQMLALVNNESKALRTAAVLVLRRLKSEKIAVFLNDNDEYIATEVARAINDDLSIINAMPALVEMLNQSKFSSEPLLRRAINAALRVGNNASLTQLINFTKRQDISDVLRAEAIATLGTWANPSPLDRVDGRFRGYFNRDKEIVKTEVTPQIANFLKDKNPLTIIAIAQLLDNLKIEKFNNELTNIYRNNEDTKVKVTIIEALGNLNYAEIETFIGSALQDKSADIRIAAIGTLNNLKLSDIALNEILKPILEKGTIKEKQKLISVLGALPVSQTEKVMLSLINLMQNNKLENEVLLELNETIIASKSEKLIALLAESKKSDDWFDEYKSALVGGNFYEGRSVFNTNSTAQCVRCHSLTENTTGGVGPSLAKIGTKLDRKTILESLINPSARLSPGYGQVLLKLTDGQEVTGTLSKETETELVLITSEAEPLKIPISRIAKRENMPSSMPAMGSLLTKREIRDIVEFLTNNRQ